jgi:hypothetical protein
MDWLAATAENALAQGVKRLEARFRRNQFCVGNRVCRAGQQYANEICGRTAPGSQRGSNKTSGKPLAQES